MPLTDDDLLRTAAVVVGALAVFAGGLSYLADTWRGRAQPNPVTWFLWALAPLIAFAAEVTSGVGIHALMTSAVGFTPLLVLGASFVRRGSQWRIGRFDVVCGVLSLAGIALWLASQNPDIAIGFSMLADLLAALPTVAKAWRYPETENDHMFLGGIFSGVLTLAATTEWAFAYYGFPAYILAMNVLLFVLVRFRPGARQPGHN